MRDITPDAGATIQSVLLAQPGSANWGAKSIAAQGAESRHALCGPPVKFDITLGSQGSAISGCVRPGSNKST